MAIYHHSTKIVKGAAGGSACQQAAYQAAERIYDLKFSKEHDYTRKTGVDYKEILSPVSSEGKNAWMGKRDELWNKVELNENRIDAQFARQITISLPVELNRDEQIALIREYTQKNYVERGMIADLCVHDLQSNNPHAHIMLTMRDLKIEREGAVEFGNKNRSWNDKNLLKQCRQSWQDIANKYLERAGYDARIDSRTLAEQGIDRLPQIHLGKKVIEMRQRGESNERGDLYDEIEAANNHIRDRLEELLAIDVEIEQIEQIEREIPIVTPQLDITPPEIEKTERVTANPSVIPPKIKYHPKKWQPIRQQPTNQELLKSIEDLWHRLDDAKTLALGNYRIEVDDNSIEIWYQDRLAMTIDDSGKTHLGDEEHTINQYERGLTKAITSTIERLDAETLEREREIARQRELADRELDFGEEIEYDFGEKIEQPQPERHRTRERDIGWSR